MPGSRPASSQRSSNMSRSDYRDSHCISFLMESLPLFVQKIWNYSPKAIATASAVSVPEKFCCPVIKFPSRIAKPRHKPDCT
jgi:hypothetical protein